ncbi:MAG: hypothetical protein ACFE9Q_17270 [Candidatus Hodarchaeota archaeon]
MSFGKIPKLDPALLKKIPEMVNNIAMEIIKGESLGDAVESEIKDQIKEVVMDQIKPMLQDNKMLIKVADKAVEKAIDKAWDKIKEKIVKKAGVEAPSEEKMGVVEEIEIKKEKKEKKKKKKKKNVFGSISLVIELYFAGWLFYGMFTASQTSVLALFAFITSLVMPLIGIVYSIIEIKKNRPLIIPLIALILGVFIIIFCILQPIAPLFLEWR